MTCDGAYEDGALPRNLPVRTRVRVSGELNGIPKRMKCTCGLSWRSCGRMLPRVKEETCESVLVHGGFATPRDLAFCDIGDDDVEAGHLVACLDAAGPQNILRL